MQQFVHRCALYRLLPLIEHPSYFCFIFKFPSKHMSLDIASHVHCTCFDMLLAICDIIIVEYEASGSKNRPYGRIVGNPEDVSCKCSLN